LSDDKPTVPEPPDVEVAGTGGGGVPETTAEPSAEGVAPAAAPAAVPELIAPEPGSEAEGYQRRARLAEARLNEVLAAYRQLKLDTEAHRDRMTRTLERRFDDRRDALLLEFIEILDNFDRALDAAEKSGAHDALIQGLILVRTQLVQTLRDQGLERIPVLGLPFDPETSEVVQMEAVEDADNHEVVIRELQRGYRLSGRIARPARVIVGQYKPPEPVLVGAPPSEDPSA
jgi:molecular chaperone GrpE